MPMDSGHRTEVSSGAPFEVYLGLGWVIWVYVYERTHGAIV